MQHIEYLISRHTELMNEGVESEELKNIAYELTSSYWLVPDGFGFFYLVKFDWYDIRREWLRVCYHVWTSFVFGKFNKYPHAVGCINKTIDDLNNHHRFLDEKRLQLQKKLNANSLDTIYKGKKVEKQIKNSEKNIIMQKYLQNLQKKVVAKQNVVENYK